MKKTLLMFSFAAIFAFAVVCAAPAGFAQDAAPDQNQCADIINTIKTQCSGKNFQQNHDLCASVQPQLRACARAANLQVSANSPCSPKLEALYNACGVKPALKPSDECVAARKDLQECTQEQVKAMPNPCQDDQSAMVKACTASQNTTLAACNAAQAKLKACVKSAVGSAPKLPAPDAQ